MEQSAKKNLLPIVLIAASILLLVVVRIVIQKSMDSSDSMTSDAPEVVQKQEAPAQPVKYPDAVTLVPKLVTNSSGDESVEIWFQPAVDAQNIITMTIEVEISSPDTIVRSLSSSATIDEQFVQDGWKIPFATLNNDNGVATLQFSAVYLNSTPYAFEGDTLLASFPIAAEDEDARIVATVLPQDSKLFNFRNELLGFSNTGTPIELR